MSVKHLLKSMKHMLYADHILINRIHQWVPTYVPVIFLKIDNFQAYNGWMFSIHISTTSIHTIKQHHQVRRADDAVTKVAVYSQTTSSPLSFLGTGSLSSAESCFCFRALRALLREAQTAQTQSLVGPETT